MAGKRPAFILKNFTVQIAAVSYIGQVEEIVLPVVEFKTEEMQNGGMIKPAEIKVGLNATTASIKLPGFDPAILSLYGVAPGVALPVIAYGYMQDENGEEHAARCEMACSPKKHDPGTWGSGKLAPVDTDWSVNSYTLYVDDEEIAAVDDFSASFGGVEVFPGLKDALRIE